MASNTDENENHWPGYVDALTTMTMVLTFVMMVLGIAIFALSQNVSRGLIEQIANAVQVPTDPEITTQEDIAKDVIARIGELARRPAGSPASSTTSTDPIESITSQADPAAEPKAGPARMDAKSDSLRIIYKPRATNLDDAAREELTARLKAMPKLAEASRIDILAGIDPENVAVSDAKRVAFYRAMRTRAELMQQGIQATRIHVRIDRETPGQDVLVIVKP